MQEAALAIVGQGKPIPACLVDRFNPLLSKQNQLQVVRSSDHWLDQLMDGIAAHQEQYLVALDEVATKTNPPVQLFQAIDPAWKPFGKEFRRLYADALRNGGAQERARIECQAFLDQVPAAARAKVLLAASAYCYTLGKEDENTHFSDNCVWQLGEKEPTGTRSPGIAQMSISALRQIGLIGEPVWTQEGAVLAYNVEHQYSGVPVTFNGTWFNWLKSVSPQAPSSMGLIPKEVRNQAKAIIAKLTDSKFIGMELIMASPRRGKRLVAHTKQGNLFGVISKGHEKRLRDHKAWQIEWATATDGNVHAILRPVAVRAPLMQAFADTRGKRKLLAMKQLELPLYEDKAPAACGSLRLGGSERSKPVQLKLEALAA